MCKKSLASACPHLLKEWDYEKNNLLGLDPDKIKKYSKERAWWVCEKGHKWISTISGRAYSNYGCPYCCGHKASKENNLFLCFPDLVKEWDYEKNTISPKEVTKKSEKRVWWVCEKGHSWNARVGQRKGCPECYKNSWVNEKNRLSTTHPHLLKEWDYEKNAQLGLTPDNISYGSKREKVWWVCKNNHSWSALPNSRTAEKSGCPVCSKNNVVSQISQQWLDSFNNPDLIREHHIKINDKPFIVDAYDPQTNTIYEYLGKFWHGHPTLQEIKKSKINPVNKRPYKELYEETLIRLDTFRKNGYNVIYKWED